MKRVLISQSVGDFISIPEHHGFEIEISERVLEKAADFIARESSPPLLLLIFADKNEFEQLYRFFRTYHYTEAVFRCIVINADKEELSVDEDRVGFVLDYRGSRIPENEALFIINKAFHQMDSFFRSSLTRDEYMAQLTDTKQDQEDLINLGKALSLEKDSDKLLRLILFLSKKITGADAGSIFLIEELEDGGKQLRFKYSHTFSKQIPIEEFVLPYNTKSIAGYVAIYGKVLNLPDVYNLSENDPVSFNKSIDQQQGYQSRTMLVVPMKNHIDQIIGVIQLINSKEDLRISSKSSGNEAFEIKLETPEDFLTKVVPFDERYNSLMEAVASQAAIALENNRMIKQIETQFEEFVKASVTAIESRDIATSGHSFRVAKICTEMARAINLESDGPFKDLTFSETEIKELEYAALLHDFGKVYIDLAIFMKGKKLFPKDFENVMLKINYLYRIIELNYAAEERKIAEMKAGNAVSAHELEKHQSALHARLARIRSIKDTIAKLNEPTVTDKDPRDVLEEIMMEIEEPCCIDIDGNRISVISDFERDNLEIRRGSLNEEERREIESHVTHTYNFVSKIPWPPEFKRIPEIAAKHHEKLDGTGYPNRLKGKDQIPVQARMMAIADVYDALTATDRPYKKSIPTERALNILQDEANHDKIDADLLAVFINHQIYEKVTRDEFK